MRRISLAAPTAAAIFLRVAQLMILIAGAQVLPSVDTETFLAAFSVVAGFAIFADAGAPTYLITTRDLNRGIYDRAVLLQITVATAGALLSAAFALLTLPWSSAGFALLVLGSLGAAQVFDSVTRAARSALLREGHNSAYALGDALAGGSKVAIAILMITLDSALMLAILPVAACTVAAMMYSRSRRGVPAGRASPGEYRRVLQYGVSGAVSGLYSQAPYLVTVALAPVAVSAVLSVILRVYQPLEIAPATASQQLLARLRTRSAPILTTWSIFAATGAVLALAVLSARPIIMVAFDTEGVSTGLLAAMALVAPLKFGNYALVSFLLASRGVNLKTVVSLGVGAFSVLASLILIPTLLAFGAIGTMLLSEIALALGLVSARSYLHRKRKESW